MPGTIPARAAPASSPRSRGTGFPKSVFGISGGFAWSRASPILSQP
jgi:hypothetical protein